MGFLEALIGFSVGANLDVERRKRVKIYSTELPLTPIQKKIQPDKEWLEDLNDELAGKKIVGTEELYKKYSDNDFWKEGNFDCDFWKKIAIDSYAKTNEFAKGIIDKYGLQDQLKYIFKGHPYYDDPMDVIYAMRGQLSWCDPSGWFGCPRSIMVHLIASQKGILGCTGFLWKNPSLESAAHASYIYDRCDRWNDERYIGYLTIVGARALKCVQTNLRNCGIDITFYYMCEDPNALLSSRRGFIPNEYPGQRKMKGQYYITLDNVLERTEQKFAEGKFKQVYDTSKLGRRR